VREEKPIVLSDFSEPEPDIVVVKGTLRDTPRHPTPANTLLVVEVSESSLAADRKTKGAIYAKHGIQEYWILNLRRRELEIRRDPGLVGDEEYGYRFLQVIPESGSVAPLAAPDRLVLVADMLPSELSPEEL
jgi:Uma2 family endonuclease